MIEEMQKVDNRVLRKITRVWMKFKHVMLSLVVGCRDINKRPYERMLYDWIV